MKAANRVVEPVVRRRRWPALLALLVVAAGTGGLVAYWAWWPRELCRRWQDRVAQADDASLPAAVAGLDRCGRHAVDPLVALLASPKTAAAEAGEAALDKRIRRIRAGAGDAWQDAAQLAEALRRALDSAPPESQSRHVRLAMALLEAAGRLSIDYPTDEAACGRATAACETVLRLGRSGIEPARFVAEHAAPLKTAARPRSPVRHAGSDSAPPQPGRAEAIPIETPPGPTGGQDGPILQAPGPLPSSMPAAPVAVPPHASQSAAPAPRTAANASARVNPIRREGSDGVRPASAVQTGDGAPVESSAAAVAPSLASRTAWSLFADLAGEGEAASWAAAELHRRGFRPSELELGRRFAVAGPDERVRLAESLPFQTGIDVRPWLIHLADDQDPAVRVAAVTIMGTSNDPQMLARLRQLALSDPDELVRQQARKLTSK